MTKDDSSRVAGAFSFAQPVSGNPPRVLIAKMRRRRPPKQIKQPWQLLQVAHAE